MSCEVVNHVYTQTSAGGALADADIVAGARVVHVHFVKISAKASGTAGSVDIEDQAGNILYTMAANPAAGLNQHVSFNPPIKSSNGLQVDADGTITSCTLQVGYS